MYRRHTCQINIQYFINRSPTARASRSDQALTSRPQSAPPPTRPTRKIAGSTVGADAVKVSVAASEGPSDAKTTEKKDARRTAWEKWVVEKEREHRQQADQELAAQRLKREQEEKVGYS